MLEALASARACSASKNAFALLSSGASESPKPTASPRAAATARTFLAARAARACVTCTAHVGKLCAAALCSRWPSLLDGLLECLCRVTLKLLGLEMTPKNVAGGAVLIEAAFSSASCYASISSPGCKC